jgi:hypothetical protein
MLIALLKHLSEKQNNSIQRILSLQNYGLSAINPEIFLYFTKISWTPRRQDQGWIGTYLCFVSKPPSNWRHSGASATDSSESMQHIILRITKKCFYLQSWPGTTGDMVSDIIIIFSARSAHISNIGVPVAWMLTTNGTTSTISFFLNWVKEASPMVRPTIFMTDCDQAQIAAINAVYPETKTLLCLWHVLRAIRSHFVTEAFPALWHKIKVLVNTKDLAEFHNLCDYIFTDPSVPSSVVQYMTKWMKVPHMWSKVLRKKRSIYHEGDTNMLLEGYVVDI